MAARRGGGSSRPVTSLFCSRPLGLLPTSFAHDSRTAAAAKLTFLGGPYGPFKSWKRLPSAQNQGRAVRKSDVLSFPSSRTTPP